MTVNKNNRDISGVQFLDTAVSLRKYTIECCRKANKRDTFIITNKIADMSSDILRLVKSGNSIFPENGYEARIRRDRFMEAYETCQSMVTELNVWVDVSPEMRKHLQQWSEYLYEELKLIKGVLLSDKKRFSKYRVNDIDYLPEEIEKDMIENIIICDDVDAILAVRKNTKRIKFYPSATQIARKELKKTENEKLKTETEKLNDKSNNITTKEFECLDIQSNFDKINKDLDRIFNDNTEPSNELV